MASEKLVSILCVFSVVLCHRDNSEQSVFSRSKKVWNKDKATVQEPQILILPSTKTHLASVGAALNLSCNVRVPEGGIITNVSWINPKGEDIGPGERIVSVDASEDGGKGLFFHTVTEADSGNYTCRANYVFSRDLKKSVFISFPPIRWGNVSEEQHAQVGHEYKVSCEVDARPNPEVKWMKEGVVISEEWMIFIIVVMVFTT